MPATALAITHGYLATDNGKTTHGLIRGSERFRLVAVLDSAYDGRDAGEVMDGVHRDIPVFGSLEPLLESCAIQPEYAIIGVALEGGRLPDDWKPLLLDLANRGLSIVSGLHTQLSDCPELVEAARRSGVQLIDIRKPKRIEDLSFFSGEIFDIDIPRIAVLGTDCAVGKRTTCGLVTRMCRNHGIAAEMVYTGQTGWMQGYPYGFILDATPNDFVSGELERAIVQCARERQPDLILLEGQSSLRNPFGPCGSELLLSGGAKHTILQHMPFRAYIEDVRRPECRMPRVQDEIALIRCYGSETIAVCLNGLGGSREDLAGQREMLQGLLNIPVILPMEHGLDELLPAIRRIVG